MISNIIGGVLGCIICVCGLYFIEWLIKEG